MCMFFRLFRDGDLALSHFHWKIGASEYHRCQRNARGMVLAMLLLAVAAAEAGKFHFANIFCLASGAAGYESLLCHQKTKDGVCMHLV